MHWLDWSIVILPMVLVVGLAVYAGKYARTVVNYLAAGRVAGRYVISIGDMTGCLSVLTLVAASEQSYYAGFGVGFWTNIVAPIGIVLSLTGFCTYRWRETRCLSKGQFIELRYGSKSFRVFTAFISTVSEMLTNALSPAIAANFFIYYLGLPHKIMICGVGLPCYVILVAMCLALAILIIWPAGRISLLVTDSIQGILSYPIFVILTGYILLKFSWNLDIAPVLWDRVPGESFIHPYDIDRLRDFNLFALIAGVTSTIMNRASWIGNDTTNSGRSPNEQKMAGVLGAWRNGFSTVMIMLLGIVTIAFMNSAHFSDKGKSNPFNVTNNEVRQELSLKVLDHVIEDRDRCARVSADIKALAPVAHEIGRDAPLSQTTNLDTRYYEQVKRALGDSPEDRYAFQSFRSLYSQMMMPVMLRNLLPVGLGGLFCLLMVMLLISTDDSRIFNAACCIVQDMVLPFYRKRLSRKAHLLLLRLTSLGVALFFLAVAVCMAQLDYINMLLTILMALWLGGAGPIMVFGLYTRFGNLVGAWCAIIFGSGVSLAGLIAQRTWTQTIYPFLEINRWIDPCNNVLILLSSPFEPWIHWRMDAVKFPINSVEIFFLSMMLAIISYIVGSLLTYKPYDLDKLLHRSKDPIIPREKWTLRNLFSKLIGITPEYTRGDKFIAWTVFVYTFIFSLFFAFIVPVVWNMFYSWPHPWWDYYFYIVYLLVPCGIGIVSTVWFLWGGLIDMRRLFIDLDMLKDDPADNGQLDCDLNSPNATAKGD